MAKNLLRMLLDTLMTILYLLLMFSEIGGNLFHEAVGLAIGILFVSHLILNQKMISGLLNGIRKKTVSSSKIALILPDALLCIVMPTVIITGIFISKNINLFEPDISYSLLLYVHNIASYFGLGILAVHLLMHAKYLLGVIKTLPKTSEKDRKWALLRLLAALTTVVLVYCGLCILQSNQKCNGSLDMSDCIDCNQHIDNEDPQLSSTPDEILPSDSPVSDNSAQGSSSETQQQIIPTLQQYLSELFCSGCKRHCSLDNPSCSKGEKQAQDAQAQYNATYNISER